MTKALSVFRDALQEFVLPSGGHFQTCSTENKMQLCNCYLRNRQRDHRGTQSHTRSTQFCFENIYSGKKKTKNQQLDTYWFRFKCSKRTQLHKAELSCASPKEAKCFTRSYLCASIQQPTGSAAVAELTRGSQQITSLDANPCLKYTRIPMMEQENALKTLKIQHSKTAGKGQWSRSCPDSWLPYRRYLPNTVWGHS